MRDRNNAADAPTKHAERDVGQRELGYLESRGMIFELVHSAITTPNDASAVMLNVTVTEASGAGFLTVYPCRAPRPNASNLNYVAGDTIPNAVIAKLDADGKVCLYTLNTTHLIADINGYVPQS